VTAFTKNPKPVSEVETEEKEHGISVSAVHCFVSAVESVNALHSNA